MMNVFERTELLIPSEGMERLREAHVAVFGVGGVGGAAVEALARAGIGQLTLIDADYVAASNINRQIIALRSTVGRAKVDVFAERISDINAACQVRARRAFVLPENVTEFFDREHTYIIDAVDTVAAKLALITEAHRREIPLLSCMGAGNKLDPTRFRVSEIAKTSVCPLCRVMRRELRARGITKCEVVWSDEPPVEQIQRERTAACLSGYCDLKPPPVVKEKRQTPGSISFVPPVAGMIAAGHVIKRIAGVGEEPLPAR